MAKWVDYKTQRDLPLFPRLLVIAVALVVIFGCVMVAYGAATQF